MWYFIVCVATPFSVNCSTPVSVPTQKACRQLEEAYRGLAQSMHNKSRAEARCVAVAAAEDPTLETLAPPMPAIRP